MSIGGEQLSPISGLAEAIGLLREGELSGDWFDAPLGDVTRSDAPGLATILHNDAQRDALVGFVDDVLERRHGARRPAEMSATSGSRCSPRRTPP